jgi:hypothetical protein
MGQSAIELVIEAVHGKMATQAVPFYVGNRHRAEHKEELCVVWVPRRGSVTAPKRLEHEHPEKPGFKMRPLDANGLVLDAYLYASALDQLESLWCEVLTATHVTLGVSSTPGDYIIITEEDARGVSRGDFTIMVQRFTFDMVLTHVTAVGVGVKTDPTVWARGRVIATAADLSYGIDPVMVTP